MVLFFVGAKAANCGWSSGTHFGRMFWVGEENTCFSAVFWIGPKRLLMGSEPNPGGLMTTMALMFFLGISTERGTAGFQKGAITQMYCPRTHGHHQTKFGHSQHLVVIFGQAKKMEQVHVCITLLLRWLPCFPSTSLFSPKYIGANGFSPAYSILRIQVKKHLLIVADHKLFHRSYATMFQINCAVLVLESTISIIID